MKIIIYTSKLLWNNNRMFRVSFLALTVLLLSTSFNGFTDVCPDINKSITAGDVPQLSKYLNATVEISVLNQEGYFSKSQVVSILFDFFKNNPPKDFVVKQGGSNSENTRFSIGTYFSTTGMFKIYYVVKKEQDTESIHKFTIEKK